VGRGEKALVLLRVQSSTGLANQSCFAYTGLGSIDRDELPKLYSSLPSASSDLARLGWCSWMLEPGTYCLVLGSQPWGVITEMHVSREQRDVHSPDETKRPAVPFPNDGWMNHCGRARLWLEVPRSTPVIYAGSLQWRFRLLEKGSAWSGRPAKWSWEALDLSFDEVAARQAAQAVLGPGQPVVTQAVRFGMLGDARAWRDATVRCVAGGEPDALLQPEWVSRGMGRMTGIHNRMPRIHGTREKSPGDSPVIGGLGGLELLYYAYIPVGTVIGAANGQAKAKTMESFSREFLSEFQALHPRETLIREFAARRPTVDLVTGATPALICEVSIVRAELNECLPRGNFCLELAARFAWRRADTGELVVERVVSSTHPDSLLPGNDFFPDRVYEHVVFSSPSHPVGEFAKPGGAKLLAADIPAVLKTLADAAAEEWLGPEASGTGPAG
jgi:hypothetical protein